MLYKCENCFCVLTNVLCFWLFVNVFVLRTENKNLTDIAYSFNCIFYLQFPATLTPSISVTSIYLYVGCWRISPYFSIKLRTERFPSTNRHFCIERWLWFIIRWVKLALLLWIDQGPKARVHLNVCMTCIYILGVYLISWGDSFLKIWV